MPMPPAYRHADAEWQAFIADAKDRLDGLSDNTAYTTVDAVFRVFRRRVTAADGLRLASIMPAVMRAVFVADWRPEVPPLPFLDRQALTAEVKAVRPHHSFHPDNAIAAVAWAVRRHVRQIDFDRVLADLPQGARDFWHVDVDDPRELAQRIV